MNELYPEARPRDVVPGAPEDVEALAVRLATYADEAGEAAARMRAIDAGAWVGEAGDAFREVIGDIPAKLERASEAFGEAVSALRSYARALREAQATAGRAVELFTEAVHQTRAWVAQSQAYEEARRFAAAAGGAVATGPLPSLDDPGEHFRQEAWRLVDRAREDVETAARRSAVRLEEAGASAPNKPGFLKRALGVAGDFAGGVGESTVGLATFAFKLSPTYALVNPDGYVENLIGMGQGLAYGVAHPVDFAKAVTNWDMWLDNPARALGQLVPEAALALATAGAGAAAKGAGTARRVARPSDELATVGRVTGRAVQLRGRHAQKWRAAFTTTDRQLQAKFKHAEDFGIAGKYERSTATAFRDALLQHVKNPAHSVIEGTYRGNPAIFHVDRSSGQLVIQTTDGRFLSGWKLNAQQLKYVLERGTLGGGR